jgi:hypothetical protein
MEEITALPSELIATPIKMALPIKIKDTGSIILENPLGVLEKLGKYEFIYDYKVNVSSWWDSIYASSMPLGQSLVPQSNLLKEGGSNANMIAPSGYWSGQSSPQPVKVNSDPQVGTFSKGNIVNVLRFDGSNAIIQNPNYIDLDPNAPKSFWAGLIGDLKNQKEFKIPKEYLRKADDNLAVTVSTGILYGANMIPQIVYNYPIKTIPTNPITQTILEENASFVLSRDFQYVSGYGSSYCSPDGLCTADMSPKYSTLKAGTKVTGRLFREIDNTAYKLQMGAITPPNYKDYLAVKGYGSQGSINIPIEYLSKEVPTNSSTNSGVVLPVEDNNKNLLMIVGAFLVGYLLFNKDTPTT